MCLFFRALTVQTHSCTSNPSLDPTGTDGVCSFTQKTPLGTTQQSFSSTPTVLQRRTSSNIQSSCPSTAFSPPRPPISRPSAIHLPPPSFRAPWPAAEGVNLSRLRRNTQGSVELMNSHKKEMELRVTAVTWGGVTVGLHCFTLVIETRWSASSLCHDGVCWWRAEGAEGVPPFDILLLATLKLLCCFRNCSLCFVACFQSCPWLLSRPILTETSSHGWQ